MFFLFLAFVFLLLLTSFSKPNTILNNNINTKVVMVFLICFLTVNIVGRELVDDTATYITTFQNMQFLDLKTAYEIYPSDMLFFLLQWISSKLSVSPIVFLSFIWFTFLFLFLKTLNKLFEPWQVTFIFFTYTCYSFFYSYTIMALRQGLSLGFIFLLIAYYLKNEKISFKKSLLLITISSLFHWSALPIGIIILFLSKYDVRFRHILLSWFFFAGLYIFHLQEKILGPILRFIPKIDGYSSSQAFAFYTGGSNRIDFLVFSFFWIILGVSLHQLFFKDDNYKKILKVYVCFNIVFLCVGFVAYSDRIAGYSWMLSPLIIWYPILKSKQYFWPLSTVVILCFLIISYLTGTLNYLIPFQNMSSPS